MKTKVIIQVYSENGELLSKTTQEIIKRHEELGRHNLYRVGY